MKEFGSFYKSQITREAPTVANQTDSGQADKSAKRFPNKGHSLLLGAVASIALLSGACADKKPSPPKALIIDQLSFTDNNPQFLNDTAKLLIDSGYNVTLIPLGNVKVEMYRELPQYNDKLVIIRSHSTGILNFRNSPQNNIKIIGLFTSEPYSYKRFVPEQIALEVQQTHYPDRSELYFGISQYFVEREMKGSFKGSTIIMTGCNGAETDGMAQAFFKKGAATFIGWDNSVTAQHSDKATEILLKHLEAEDMSPADAVKTTMAEVGPDPFFGGKLVAFEKPQSN